MPQSRNGDLNEFEIESTTSTSKGSHNSKRNVKGPRYSFQKRPFVIGVAGGTASGKSTVCSKIMQKLGPIDPTSKYLSHEKRVICISQDSFYRKLNDEDRALVEKGNFNFDHPSAFDVDLMVRTLRDVLNGKMVKVPIYNYMENEISDQEEVVYSADVILVEGLLLFYFPEVREMFQMKIFVDTDPDTRLSRRVVRDVKERNRDLDIVLSQYTKFVKPSFEEFCLPTKKYADIIVPRGPDNEVAVDLIVTHVRSVFDPSIRHQSIKYDTGRINSVPTIAVNSKVDNIRVDDDDDNLFDVVEHKSEILHRNGKQTDSKDELDRKHTTSNIKVKNIDDGDVFYSSSVPTSYTNGFLLPQKKTIISSQSPWSETNGDNVIVTEQMDTAANGTKKSTTTSSAAANKSATNNQPAPIVLVASR